MVLRLLADLVLVYTLLLIARAVMDLVISLNRGFRPSGAVAVLFEVVYTTTDPPLRALRRVIPPLRVGTVAFDLGFLVLLIALQVLRGVLLASA